MQFMHHFNLSVDTYYVDSTLYPPCPWQDPHDVDPRLAGARGGGVVEGLEVEHQPRPPQLAVQERADLET